MASKSCEPNLTNQSIASSGDAAAAEALPESVDTEEPEEPDEPKCDNNNKPWCVDCGDADAQGNCKTGDHAGCRKYPLLLISRRGLLTNAVHKPTTNRLLFI